MAISVAVILNVLMYIPYVIESLYWHNDVIADTFFYLSFTTLNEIHWVVAHRYFQSTVYLPYIIKSAPVPKRAIFVNTALFCAVTALIFIGGIFIFLDKHQKWKEALFFLAAL